MAYSKAKMKVHCETEPTF